MSTPSGCSRPEPAIFRVYGTTAQPFPGGSHPGSPRSSRPRPAPAPLAASISSPGIPAGCRIARFPPSAVRPRRSGGLDQHVQRGAQVGVRVDDVGPGPGVIAALFGPFRHRSQRLPGGNERGLQADAGPVTIGPVRVGRAQTRSPIPGRHGEYRMRPRANGRGTAHAGSRFPLTNLPRSSPDPRPPHARAPRRRPVRGP